MVIPNENINNPHLCFQITASKSMVHPTNQFTLPARVEKGLHPRPYEKAVNMWLVLSPYFIYCVDFVIQNHPGGGWRSTKDCDWPYMVLHHNIVQGDVLTFIRIVKEPGFVYRVRSPALDQWNMGNGCTREYVEKLNPLAFSIGFPPMSTASSASSACHSTKKKMCAAPLIKDERVAEEVTGVSTRIGRSRVGRSRVL